MDSREACNSRASVHRGSSAPPDITMAAHSYDPVLSLPRANNEYMGTQTQDGTEWVSVG